MHHTPLPDTLLRALAGGVAGNMLAWFGAIVVWHHLLQGEAVAAVRRGTSERKARVERAAAGN
jgi:crotonobetainyl-CoA:carnitine CoA-transferase CaiB-like acyl-CoA transferase